MPAIDLVLQIASLTVQLKRQCVDHHCETLRFDGPLVVAGPAMYLCDDAAAASGLPIAAAGPGAT